MNDDFSKLTNEQARNKTSLAVVRGLGSGRAAVELQAAGAGFAALIQIPLIYAQF